MSEHTTIFTHYLAAWLYSRTHGLLSTHRITKVSFTEWRLVERITEEV